MSDPLRILALEPYYAGSHRAFIDGWINHSRHDWTLLTLPGHHWKWRMRHSALHMAHEVNGLLEQGERWDAVFATDMLNVAEFRGLVHNDVRQLPSVLYFHENQFAYPDKRKESRDFHFGFTNLTSSVAADAIWFNSAFNRDSFIHHLHELKTRLTDFVPEREIESVARRSQIHYPGIAIPESITQHPPESRASHDQPLHLIWAARWEHDKQPEQLLAALRLLRDGGTDFRVSVIGQRFRKVPGCFADIETEFRTQIVRFGFQPSRAEYFAALIDSDVFVSTASHEFFGLSAAEAIASGLHALLPDRLAYPELLGSMSDDISPFVYDGTVEGLVTRIRELADDRTLLNSKLASAAVRKFSWPSRAPELDNALENVTRQFK